MGHRCEKPRQDFAKVAKVQKATGNTIVKKDTLAPDWDLVYRLNGQKEQARPTEMAPDRKAFVDRDTILVRLLLALDPPHSLRISTKSSAVTPFCNVFT